MADLKTMREQLANIATEARSLLNQSSETKDEARAAELETQHDKAMSDFDALTAKFERVAKMEAAETRTTEAADKAERAARDDKRPGVDASEAHNGPDMGHRSAFYEMLRRGGTVEGEAAQVLAEHRAQVAGTGSAGGYTVPIELAGFIETSMIASGPMYSGDVVQAMVTDSGNPFNITTVNDTASTAGAHTEAGTVTDDGGKDVAFGQKSLAAYSFDTEWLRWSRELSQDSIFNMESILGELLGERLGRLANSKLTTGSGSSDVEGVVTNSALGKTAAGVAAITADEIIDLLHSVDPKYRAAPKTAFMFNDSTLAAVRKLKDGQGNYLWQMGNVQAGVPGNILGYNYHINQDMDSLATGNKVMLFGDFNKFIVRKVGEPMLFVGNERYAPDFGILGFIRFDGLLTNTAAIKHLVTA